MEHLEYQTGFANHFESEARAGALPREQNSPQKPPFGLYAEQLSGSAFTMARKHNLRSWLYKIRPSVIQGEFTEVGHPTWLSDPTTGKFIRTPQALRWNPYPEAGATGIKKDFIDSIFTYAINGSAASGTGCAAHMYSINKSMSDSKGNPRYAYNADAEMMIVPDTGNIIVHTELGKLALSPLYIGVIPRGIKFRVELKSGSARGYLCENFGQPFQLPDLGPIGSNGLAHQRHFETPVAAFENLEGDFELFARYQGSLWRTTLKHSPLDTVAWHGNYAPYRYDLRKYNTMGTVTYDHPDPSIFTVLTSPSAVPGTANVDFAIFPKRWMVAEHTFRPPYYHRNIMNEFMGLITGQYDAKEEGFHVGGASLHNCMTGHGPDIVGFEKGSNGDLKPQLLDNTMAFMWESVHVFWPSEQSLKQPGLLDAKYFECWQKLPKLYK
ncbi:MAG: homogentisate 1,2-dioxygenase [Bdellovibrionales bacterium]|nr:homogentisate 1,2-dioxygenase [Bdellovibrionales bacterium]